MALQVKLRLSAVIVCVGLTLACGNSATAPGETAGSIAYRLQVSGSAWANDLRTPNCVPPLEPPEGQTASTIIRLRRSGNQVIGESSDAQLGNIQIRLEDRAPLSETVRPIAGEIGGWALNAGYPLFQLPSTDVRVTFSAQNGSKRTIEAEAIGPWATSVPAASVNGAIYGDIAFENGRGASAKCQRVSFSLIPDFAGS